VPPSENRRAQLALDGGLATDFATRRVGPHGVWTLFALAEAGRFALEVAQIIQLGAADAAGADNVDVIEMAGMHRKMRSTPCRS